MKILLLGCGIIGSSAVRQLVKYSNAEVVAADVDINKAKTASTKYGAERVTAKRVDIDDHKGLISLIKSVNPDVVASTIGPFYRNAGKVYRACIESGKNCVDICDDIPGVQQAMELHEDAKKAGIVIISGVGDSPGLTNLIVKYCCDQLDSVDDINILWAAPVGEVGIAQFYHGIHCFAFPHQYSNGKLIGEGGKITVEFGQPLGKVNLLYCDHPESFTLPMYIKGVKNVVCAGAIWPEVPGLSLETVISFKDLLMKPVNIHGTDVTLIEVLSTLSFDVVQDQIVKWKAAKVEYDAGGTVIEVKGMKANVKTKFTFSGVGRSMTSTTPRSLTTVAQMIANGEVKVKGSYAPEGCIDPLDYIKAFSGGLAVFKTIPSSRVNEYIVDIVPV